MSILLPADPSELIATRARARRTRLRVPPLMRLRGIDLWHLLSRGKAASDPLDASSSPRKLRLVTSRWVDRPTERAKSDQ